MSFRKMTVRIKNANIYNRGHLKRDGGEIEIDRCVVVCLRLIDRRERGGRKVECKKHGRKDGQRKTQR